MIQQLDVRDFDCENFYAASICVSAPQKLVIAVSLLGPSNPFPKDPPLPIPAFTITRSKVPPSASNLFRNKSKTVKTTLYHQHPTSWSKNFNTWIEFQKLLFKFF